MEYIVVLIPVLLIVIMGWGENESKGGEYGKKPIDLNYFKTPEWKKHHFSPLEEDETSN